MSAFDRRAEFVAGALAIAPLAAAATPFGLIMGAEAVRHGLDPAEAALMSATVFAGGAQFLAIGLWQRPAPWETLTLAVFLVNLRHVLLAASIVRKMGLFKPWQRFPAAFLLTDEGWATSERRAAARPLTPAFYAGVGLTMYGVWLVATIIGAIAGGLIPRPETFGLDFAFPAVFIGMVVSFAKSWRAVPIVAASAIAAFIAHRALNGAWYVFVGALAGMAVAFAERPKADDGAPP